MKNKAVKFVASVDQSNIKHIGEIVHELENQGLHINTVRRLTGTISGQADDLTVLSQVNIQGLNIEPEETYSI